MKKVLIIILTLLALTVAPQPVHAEDMCCPLGYSRSIWECPFDALLDSNKCCRRMGFAQYDVVTKVKCSDVNIDINGVGTNTARVCKTINDATQRQACVGCFSQNKVWTAVGCIATDPSSLFQTLFTFGMGIAGGIAFLLIILGGFQMMTAAGNPEQMNAGRELIGSAITGLILIIFSVFLLRVIGYDILRIPGFG